MGIFDDKKYESLDFLSQAIEPVELDILKTLGNLPNEITITFKDLKEIQAMRYGDIDTYCALKYMLALNRDDHSSYREEQLLADSYKFKIEPNTIIDFEQGAIYGSIKLVKVDIELDEKTLLNIMSEKGMRHINGIGSWRLDSGRCAEILELLGAQTIPRSPRKKIRLLNQLVGGILQEDKWKIRDGKLCENIGLWIAQYINNGNLAALSNFCRLKLMTHKGVAIYSIEEVE